MNDWRTTEALFRYALVREAADDRLTPRERGPLVRETAAKLHAHPTDGLRQVSRGTLDRWILVYRRGGFEALKPALREVGPRTDPAILAQAEDLRREAPDRTGAQIAEILRRVHGEKVPTVRTVQRHLARAGLRREAGAAAAAGFGRFEAERPNELWVADALHGPVVATERGGALKRKAICFAILDDHSRLCVGAYFEPAETELRLERTLRAALQARGVPEALYVDNGSPFASAQLERACAVLGIRLIHSRPGRPQGRGKIERFFRTLRGQFLSEAQRKENLSLPELNRLLRAWLERSYHRRAHTETEEPPAVRFASVRPRYVGDEGLREAFLWSVKRVVSKTATVSLHGNRYEVDAALCGRSVELLFDPYALGVVEVRWSGRSFGEAVAHEVSRHVHPRAEADLGQEPASPTGIDYLALLETEHERELLGRSGGIEFRRLTDEDDNDTKEE
ncbi:MAG TPA: DDE-type integrase/transposase/recombinase [Solirubrobacterales bacterium]|nr:DDE-type integrase/transposase/recombinase [Solirubrobacterales bacterium]